MSLDEHTTTDRSEHELAKEAIATALRNHARGRDNAMSSQALADWTPVAATTIRDLIPQLRRERGLPIGSANGYFLVEDGDEARRQIERQLDQAETSRRTAKEIAAAWYGD